MAVQSQAMVSHQMACQQHVYSSDHGISLTYVIKASSLDEVF